MDCGETNPTTLDFHHKDPNTKDFNISNAISRRSSVENLDKEIAKCIVLCANHHRIRHYLEDNKNLNE